MTTLQDPAAATTVPSSFAPDSRGSWIPTISMVTTRFMELRSRRGLMITIAVVVIGLPTLFLAIRLITHAVDPKNYAPAGGSDIFSNIVGTIMYVFGFIVAAMLGCTAGSSDLTDGMFRHAVVTGRSRLAIYLARIPAGLAIITAMIAVGFTIISLVSCLAAPTSLNYDGVNIPPGLTQSAFVTWSVDHADQVVCSYNLNGPNVGPNTGVGKVVNDCGFNGVLGQFPPGVNVPPKPTQTEIDAAARFMALQNYSDYKVQTLSPSNTLMIESGLWILLEAAIGFIVGLGLGSLLGQRTVAVILMIILEVILTPLLATDRIPYMINGQRAIVGLAMAHIQPDGITRVFGTGGGPNARSMLIPESTTVAIIVIVAWLVGWTAIGAWRMVTRDA